MKLIKALFFTAFIFFTSNSFADIPITIINNNKDSSGETLFVEYYVCQSQPCQRNNLQYKYFTIPGSGFIPVTLSKNEKLIIEHAAIYYNGYLVAGSMFDDKYPCNSTGNPITMYADSSKASVTCQTS